MLTGWGAGTIWSLTAVPGQLSIINGVAGTVAFVNVSGSMHTTDVVFGSYPATGQKPGSTAIGNVPPV